MTMASDRKVVYALLAIAALCLVGLGVSLYRAKSSALKRLRKQFEQKQAELQEARAKIVKLPDLEARYGHLEARLAVLEPALPDSAYMPTFLAQIERLATTTDNRIVMIRPKAKPAKRTSGVTVNNETGEVIKNAQPGAPGQPAPEDQNKIPYDYTPIEFKIEGSYPTIIAFLRELQQFPKMIAVNDIRFSPAQGGRQVDRSPDLAATLDLIAVVTKGVKHGTPQ